MSETTLIVKNSDPGYVVAWKYKYEFKTGKYDEVMTYGEAKQRAEQLAAENKEMVFWPEKQKETAGGENRFYNPAAH